MRKDSPKTVLLVATAFLLWASSIGAQAKPGSKPNATTVYRLGASAVPKAYDLNLEPDLKTGKFTGVETILIATSVECKQITLNGVDLEVTGAWLADPGKSREPLQTEIDKRNEQITFRATRSLAAGEHALRIAFAGKLNTQLRGLYGVSKTKSAPYAMAVTQFEPADARRMFPCFDEPAFKAKFKLTVMVDHNLTAISNAPVLKQTSDPSSGKTAYEFRDTPELSTYLVALFVGPLVSTPPRVVNGVPIRVWSTQAEAKRGRTDLRIYARDLAAEILPFYENYFGRPYMGEKLDLIALPEFEAGAMENMGAISFRENALLFDPDKDSLQSKLSITNVVAHEMAHLWFGDLVTMEWWNDVWLNEAFATWMAETACNQLHPEWRCWDAFAESRVASMRTDALNSSRAVESPVENPVEAFEMFDDITYSKGASIIRMLEKYVGETTFRDGVRRYMASHEFGNATTSQLWEAIGSAFGKPVADMMQNWVHQPGYPLVQIREDGDKILLSQRRFLANSRRVQSSSTTWDTPLAVSSAGAPDPRFVLLKNPDSTVEGWHRPYFANCFGSGYYLVAYSEEDLNSLAKATLSAVERYTLIEDQSALVRTGTVPIQSYLSYLESFADEQDPFVIDAVSEQLSTIWNLLPDSIGPEYERFCKRILKPTADRLTWAERADDSDWTKLARAQVLRVLGTIGGDRETIDLARQHFKKFMAGQSDVGPSLLPTLFGIVSYNGDQKDYDNVRLALRVAQTPTAEKRALFALSNFRRPDLLVRTLRLTLTSQVRTQDAPLLLAHCLDTKFGSAISWPFLKQNWSQFRSKWPPYMIPSLISANAIMRTPSEESEFKQFFATHPIPEGAQEIARTSERIENNVFFTEKLAAPGVDWLNKSYK